MNEKLAGDEYAGISQIVPAGEQRLAPLTSASPDNVVEAEWVRRYPARKPGRWLIWVWAALKIALAGVLTWLFYQVPPQSFPDPFQNWKNPVVVFLLVCFIGKTLYDTLFYDHYRP